MAGEDTSLYTLMRELAHGLFAGSGLLPTVLGMSTGKGSTSTLVDARDIAWAGLDTDFLDGRWIYWHRTRGTATAGAATTITTDKEFGLNALAGMEIEITAGTGVGQVRTVTSNTTGANSVITVPAWTTNPDNTSVYAIYPVAASIQYSRITTVSVGGTITFDPVMSAIVEDLSDYSLHLFHPKLLTEALSWALGRMKYRTLLPASFIPDGDMEDDDYSHWTEAGTPTSVDKEDATESEFGRQWLKIVAAAAADGVNSDDVWAEAGEPYRYFALVRVDGASNSLDVILTDVDGSDFETVNVAPRRFLEVRVTGDVPSGCERMQARFHANGGAVTFYVVYSSLLFPRRDWVEVPRFANAGQIQEVLRLPQGSGGSVANTFMRMSRRLEPVNWYPEVDARAGKQAKIVVDAWDDPLFVRGSRSFPALSSDRETTRADKDAVLAGARVYLRRQFVDAEILAGSTAVLGALKATQMEDEALWNKAVYGAGEGMKGRIRGLRLYERR